jgi:PAS domain S-box-containing protein
MIAGSQEMSVRHSSFQFLDEAELEQALSIAEDAREEAARLAHELDVSHALLAKRERELLALQVEMEKRETEAAARLREMEDRLLKGEARDKLLAEELQMAIEELSVSNQELECTNQDLEMRVAERTARVTESERRLSLAQAHAGADIWAWEILTDIVSWSGNHDRSGEEIYGTVTASRSSWIRNIHPDDRAQVSRAFRACLEQRSADLSVQYRIRHPRRGTRWFEIRGQVSYGKDDRPLRISGLRFDITDRKVAEDALRESEGLLAAIFAQAQVGLFEVGPDGRFRMVNDRFCAMLDRSREELLALRVQDLTHPDDVARNMPLFERMVETGEGFQVDKRYLRPDGTYIWMASSASRIVDAQGCPIGALAVTVDLTERMRAERVLREARDQAEAADRAKSRFLAAVSHDLRQPVMSANLFLDLLRKRSLSPAERDLVEPLANSLSGLTGMLNGLLEVARLDAGIVRAEPSDFSLDDLLRRLAGEFQGLARECRLQFHIPQAPWTVRSDPLLVEMILRNLISNAFKYTEAGGVSIVAQAGAGSVAIDVIDTGRGIASTEFTRIFDDYYQGGNAARDHSRGFGIGLATARRVAALLGTAIEVQSEVGKGSTFTLSLPLAEGQGSSAGEPRRDERGAVALDSAPDSPLPSVLVVDDDPLVLQALELMLESWDLRVHGANCLKDAEALLETMDRPPDIVLADYTLAHGELGTDVIAAARRHGAHAAVLLTGDTSAARLAEAERSGYRLLHKPIAVDALETLIRELGSAASEVTA